MENKDREFEAWVEGKRAMIRELEREISVGREIYKTLFSGDSKVGNGSQDGDRKIWRRKRSDENISPSLELQPKDPQSERKTVYSRVVEILEEEKKPIRQIDIVTRLNSEGYTSGAGTVNPVLRRLMDENKIRRIGRGLYEFFIEDEVEV